MKKINILLATLLMGFFVSCNEDAIGDLTGKYDMGRYTFTTASQQPTEKLKKGIKALKMTLSDGSNTLDLSFGCSEWILKSGNYSPVSTVSANGEYAATLNGSNAVTEGSLDVNILGEMYMFNGLLTDAAGNRFKVDYRGNLSFEIGEDDPEASGYTATLAVSPVYMTDASGNFLGIAEGVQKYSFTVSDPDGNPAAYFDAVNTENMKVEELGGVYTIGTTYQPLSMDGGWALPAAWGGMSGGSYVVVDGKKEFMTGGKVSITVADGMEGGKLYSFAGEGLSTTYGMDETTYQNIPGTATEFNIKFVTVLQKTGMELRDQTIDSEVLGREMKYSVYLPESYDGTKTYPVLYLLHGHSGSNNDWLNGGNVNVHASTAAADSTAPEMIVVCPDAFNTFYCDGYQDGLAYMTYFFDEFIPYIEATYKVEAEKGARAIGGLSMGGYGALYYGFLHPEMFCYVYACSPAAYMDGCPNLFELMYGHPAADMPGITIETGTEDYVVGEGPSWLYGGMAQAGIACDYITRAGAHDWTFWQACTPKIMKKLGEVFK